MMILKSMEPIIDEPHGGWKWTLDSHLQIILYCWYIVLVKKLKLAPWVAKAYMLYFIYFYCFTFSKSFRVSLVTTITSTYALLWSYFLSFGFGKNRFLSVKTMTTKTEPEWIAYQVRSWKLLFWSWKKKGAFSTLLTGNGPKYLNNMMSDNDKV